MSNDELRAAAERWAFGNYPAVDMGQPWITLFRQATKLAESYLATHRADDRQAIDIDWYRAMLRENESVWPFYAVRVLPGGCQVYITGGDRYVKTRGQLRALCAALGIELKEIV